MSKKISIKSPSDKQAQTTSAEQWVASREEVKRLTIDIPASLHTSLKISSAQTGQTMGEIVRSCVEKYINESSE